VSLAFNIRGRKKKRKNCCCSCHSGSSQKHGGCWNRWLPCLMTHANVTTPQLPPSHSFKQLSHFSRPPFRPALLFEVRRFICSLALFSMWGGRRCAASLVQRMAASTGKMNWASGTPSPPGSSRHFFIFSCVGLVLFLFSVRAHCACPLSR
jgi:hypothetical protein